MRNAKEELLGLIEQVGSRIKCATIMNGCMFDDDNQSFYELKTNHTKEEHDKFIESLNFKYDAGYGGQELFGRIWFKDGSWADRSEYDGSEWWSYKTLPSIPDELIG